MAMVGESTDGDSSPVEEVRPRGRRKAVVMWVFVAIGFLLAIAVAFVAGKPEIAAAATVGLVVPVVIVMLVRRARRPSRGPAPGPLPPAGLPTAGPPKSSRRGRWALAVVLLVALGAVAAAFLLTTSLSTNSPSGQPPNAVARQSVDYHAAGRLVGDDIVLDETVVLSERAISGGRSAPATESGGIPPTPTVAMFGWQDAGIVNGYPSLARSRTLPWDQTSRLADTASIPLILGSLSVTVGDDKSTVILTPQDNSRVEIVLPKGALGTAAPAPTSRTDLPARQGLELIVFAVDPYVSDISFDVLAAPLRNPAGRTVYDVSLWGLWKWVAGAATTVIGGFIVDKLVDAIWRLLSRRVRSMLSRSGKAPA